MTWGEWLSVLAILLAGVALGLTLLGRPSRRARPAVPDRAAGVPVGAATTERPLVAFVANPTKPGVAELRDAAVRACAERYLPEPMWLETTEQDSGVGQTRRAVADGARVVVAVGGDGTVRAVAEGLIGTSASMGLIPQGTGNLLARNLDLPLGDL
ncbi:MAG TPA: diacylglycerol kinase family protein, partial [Actinotalea sp.]|nr:diacylglycerol kinase family protein [Actinotalea sp.]